MNRRRFLVGLGGITVGLPFLRKFATPARAAGAQDGPQRIIIVAYAMGTHVPMWRPSATGSSFELGQITASLEPVRDKVLFVSNCDNGVLSVGGDAYGYGHPAKQESLFTGTLMQSSFVGDGSNHIDNAVQSDPANFPRTPNGPSVEQFIGDALRTTDHPRASVDLGVWGPGGTFGSTESYFFFEAASNPVSQMTHPGLAFASLFNGVTGDPGEVDEAFLELQRRKKSVLDTVRDSFTDLRQGLDAEDRRILDDHADKIRQIELDMPPLAACTLPQDIPEGDAAYAGSAWTSSPTTRTG